MTNNSCGSENSHVSISNNEQLCQGLMSSSNDGLNQHSTTPKLERPTSLVGGNKMSLKNISYRSEYLHQMIHF